MRIFTVGLMVLVIAIGVTQGKHLAGTDRSMDDLRQAIDDGNIPAIDGIFASGVDRETEVMWRITPLMLASTAGHPEVVRYMLQHGANVQASNQLGWTSLHLAVQR